jgi:hypothetical protein
MTKKIKMGNKLLTYEEYLKNKPFWEKVNDNILNFIPDWLYRIYWKCFQFTSWKTRIKWLYQKLTKGFTDRDLWELDETFYKWFLPRFKQYILNSESIVDEAEFFKEAKNQLKNLEFIMDDNNFFDEKYVDIRKEFNEWFGKNLNKLWY